MTPHRLAGIGAAAVLALFAVGGTALATSNAVAPTPVALPSFAASETGTTAPTSTPDSTPDATPDDSAPSTTPSAAPAPGEPIGPDGARAAALAAVGGGVVTELEADREDGGRVEWEVEVTDGATRHKLRIDGITGEVLEREVDNRSSSRSDRSDDTPTTTSPSSTSGGTSASADDSDDRDDDSDDDRRGRGRGGDDDSDDDSDDRGDDSDDD